ncbi:MAG: hypothetical protein GQ535_17530 [Rhodobacteraceae bacterium]|nr:hypothetical protein [Paracoccaceae bacterium]
MSNGNNHLQSGRLPLQPLQHYGSQSGFPKEADCGEAQAWGNIHKYEPHDHHWAARFYSRRMRAFARSFIKKLLE